MESKTAKNLNIALINGKPYFIEPYFIGNSKGNSVIPISFQVGNFSEKELIADIFSRNSELPIGIKRKIENFYSNEEESGLFNFTKGKEGLVFKGFVVRRLEYDKVPSITRLNILLVEKVDGKENKENITLRLNPFQMTDDFCIHTFKTELEIKKGIEFYVSLPPLSNLHFDFYL